MNLRAVRHELFDQLGLPAAYDPLAVPALTANVMITIGKAPPLVPPATPSATAGTSTRPT